jgi:hypothetical protein
MKLLTLNKLYTNEQITSRGPFYTLFLSQEFNKSRTLRRSPFDWPITNIFGTWQTPPNKSLKNIMVPSPK